MMKYLPTQIVPGGLRLTGRAKNRTSWRMGAIFLRDSENNKGDLLGRLRRETWKGQRSKLRKKPLLPLLCTGLVEVSGQLLVQAGDMGNQPLGKKSMGVGSELFRRSFG